MNNDNSEWEDQLREKPFYNNHFTPQMVRHVERKAKAQSLGRKKWIISIGVLPILVIIIFMSYYFSGQVNDRQPVTQAISPNQIASNYVEQDPPSTPKEEITFPGMNGEEIKLPLQITKAVLSVDDGLREVNTEIIKPSTVDYKIPMEMKDKLQAVMVYRPDMAGSYLLLAPAGWEASAVVGANGSYGVTLTDPDDREQSLHYSDTAGSCQGCAISSIGTFFPDKADWANEQGFTVYEPLSFKEWKQQGTAGEDARTAVYKLNPEEGYDRQGAAYYEQDEDEGWYLFRHLELKLAEGEFSSDHRIDIVMDFFKTHHGVINVGDK